MAIHYSTLVQCFFVWILQRYFYFYFSSPPPSDIGKIHDGIGDKIALLIQWVATFFGGFIIGFVREWRLTLLLVAFTPFLALGGAVMAKVSS